MFWFVLLVKSVDVKVISTRCSAIFVDSFFIFGGGIFHTGCTLWYFKQVLKYKEMNIVSTYNEE